MIDMIINIIAHILAAIAMPIIYFVDWISRDVKKDKLMCPFF